MPTITLDDVQATLDLLDEQIALALRRNDQQRAVLYQQARNAVWQLAERREAEQAEIRATERRLSGRVRTWL